MTRCYKLLVGTRNLITVHLLCIDSDGDLDDMIIISMLTKLLAHCHMRAQAKQDKRNQTKYKYKMPVEG